MRKKPSPLMQSALTHRQRLLDEMPRNSRCDEQAILAPASIWDYMAQRTSWLYDGQINRQTYLTSTTILAIQDLRNTERITRDQFVEVMAELGFTVDEEGRKPTGGDTRRLF